MHHEIKAIAGIIKRMSDTSPEMSGDPALKGMLCALAKAILQLQLEFRKASIVAKGFSHLSEAVGAIELNVSALEQNADAVAAEVRDLPRAPNMGLVTERITTLERKHADLVEKVENVVASLSAPTTAATPLQPVRWEHRVFDDIAVEHCSTTAAILDEFGADGWELMGFAPRQYNPVMYRYIKRPRAPE